VRNLTQDYGVLRRVPYSRNYDLFAVRSLLLLLCYPHCAGRTKAQARRSHTIKYAKADGRVRQTTSMTFLYGILQAKMRVKKPHSC
jgi:hypothetical protein